MKGWRGWAIAGAAVLVLLAALLVTTAFLPTPSEQLAGSTTNARGNGTRAVAEVLRRNGVQVNQVTTLDEATAAGRHNSTLAVYLTAPLSQEASDQLQDVAADVVLVVGGSWVGVETLTAGVFQDDWWWRENGTLPAPACDDPDAIIAGRITPLDTGIYDPGFDGYEPSEGVTLCYLDDVGAALYATTTTPRHRLAVLAAGAVMHNDRITDEGNAALALRILGRHPQLTWYLPGVDARATLDGDTPRDPLSEWSLLPDWAPSVFAILLLAGAAAALWRGRRFGPLVREKLPIAVPASEVSAGLGRLYRQAGARGHAAAGLRAATIGRLAARLGLTAAATPELVIERLAETTGEPPEALAALFYGPAPATDPELAALAARLTDLERKLTRHD